MMWWLVYLLGWRDQDMRATKLSLKLFWQRHPGVRDVGLDVHLQLPLLAPLGVPLIGQAIMAALSLFSTRAGQKRW